MLKVIRHSLALCFPLLLMACNHADEITPRKYVGLVVGHTGQLRMDISKSIAANLRDPVPQAGPLVLTPPPGLGAMKFDFGWVTASGAIVIQNNEHAVVVLQEPMRGPGGVKWSCVVHPSSAKPNLCGAD